MKKLTSLFLLAILVCSCASETEKGVLDDIATVYDADTSYSKSFVSNTSEKRKTFNVVIQNSAMIDTLKPTVTTANSALMVYDALTSEEKENYTDIEVFLINAKKDTASFYYPMTALAPISKKAKVHRQFSDAIVNNNFEALNTINKAVEIPADFAIGLENGIKQFEADNGSLNGYYTFGIAEERDQIGTIYQYQAYLLFANGTKINYLVVVDATAGNDQLVGFKFFSRN
ncbi:hypothetical protein G5B37_06325 [Rasiella rasia]|uniref:Lipoprotein n=1 Tax=Rasiella rasia TaxID=2744027 RepID=A0A6G6GKW2_9FLAO|nr:hypothetical protein [Rasiella rasia]QIE59188.1 hypothetical protein G5B37_06325 [Rasiella rasia]